MKVVVILKETDYGDSLVSEVYGVYVDLKEFYDEAKTKGYEYDYLNKGYFTSDKHDNTIWFHEEVKDVTGYKSEQTDLGSLEDE